MEPIVPRTPYPYPFYAFVRADGTVGYKPSTVCEEFGGAKKYFSSDLILEYKEITDDNTWLSWIEYIRSNK